MSAQPSGIWEPPERLDSGPVGSPATTAAPAPTAAQQHRAWPLFRTAVLIVLVAAVLLGLVLIWTLR